MATIFLIPFHALAANNLTISSAATSNAGSVPNWVAGTGGGNVSITDIQTQLNAGTSITLTASGSIDFQGNISKTAGGNATLTANAGTDVIVDTSVTISSTTGTLGMTFDADTAAGGGAVMMNTSSSITTNGGNITFGGGADPMLNPAVGDATYTTGVTVAALNAGGGNISLRGSGYTGGVNTGSANGISSSGTIQTSSSGTVTLNGTGGGSGTGGFNHGLYFGGLTVDSGAVDITGIGGIGDVSRGVYFKSYVIANGASNITVHGIGNTNNSEGIFVNDNISTTGGNISFTGTSSGGGGISVYGAGVIASGTGAITFNGAGGGSGTGVSLSNTSTVSAVDGSISMTGTGGNSGASATIGVLCSGSIIKATGSGTISITGTGGANLVNGNHGVQVTTTSQVYATSGTMTITGTSGSGTSYGIESDTGTNIIGKSVTTTGGIILATDTISLANETINTTGAVTFKSHTAATTIGVAGASGTLAITSGILATITTGSITLGDPADTGTMTLNSYASWGVPVTLTTNASGSIVIHGDQTGSGSSFILNGPTTLSLATNFSGNLTINSGATLDVTTSNYTLALQGNFSNQGTFTPRTGTVTLNGTGQSLTGATTFYNLTKTVTAADTLTLPASATTTVTGTLTLHGAAGQLLSLRSSTPGTQWKIDPQGTRTLSYLDVKDSDNVNSTSITTAGFTITDSGNNTNWTFNTAPSITAGPSDGSSSSATPTTAGQTVTFTATATDTQGDNYYLAVCKTNSITANASSAPTCGGGAWAVSSSTPSATQATVTHATTANDDGSNAWYAFVCDNNASSLCSAASQGSGDAGSPFVLDFGTTPAGAAPPPPFQLPVTAFGTYAHLSVPITMPGTAEVSAPAATGFVTPSTVPVAPPAILLPVPAADRLQAIANLKRQLISLIARLIALLRAELPAATGS